MVHVSYQMRSKTLYFLLMDKILHQLRLVIDVNPLFAGFYTSQVV